jgi:phenylacetate-CoA ligase
VSGTTVGHDRLRARARAELAARLPDHLRRLSWDRAQLTDFQQFRLRGLLAHAIAHSPFHARRLTGLDVSRFELNDLPALPVMTKVDMMGAFDQVVTDRRLSAQRVEAHLHASNESSVPLLDDYVCLASGGSSGLRGMFVQTIGEYMDFMASFIRHGMARGLPSDGLVIGVVAAGTPIHSSGLATSLISEPVRLVPVPAVLPLPDIVARLNDLQPGAVLGYPTMLALLAGEQRAGRLRIAPAAVTTSSEQLTDADRAALTEGFGVPVTDQFSSTEGLVGTSEPGGRILTFATDMCLAEPVTADNQPVPPGSVADKMLVTNLHNLTQPLIRYELTDRFIRHLDDGAGRLRGIVDGRADSVFRYGDICVHPITFHAVLDGKPAISEFQVRQTDQGVLIRVRPASPVDTAELRDAVRAALTRAGLPAPDVAVHIVDSIDRHPETGKVIRFLPARRALTQR